MTFSLPDNWPETPEDAVKLQVQLASQVRECPLSEQPETLGGVDVAYDEAEDRVFSAITVHDAKTLEIIDQIVASDRVAFPYLPGLFSFRELPPVIKALNALKTLPDILICDGHGRAHPRRFGLASHLGVLINRPTIGCAKNHLIGQFEPPGYKRGEFSSIVDEDETVGAVLRTQTSVNPVFVSIGHLITLDDAISTVLAAAPSYRLPETTRAAD